jgi:hypothetical protein
VTIANGYVTLAELKTAIGIPTTDTKDDSELEMAIETASRQIDAHCGRGRKFWQDGAAVTRTFYPCELSRAWIDDLATTTSLVVKVDQNDDGTFETTLALNTDFILEPVNAAADGRAWESLRLLSSASVSFVPLSSGRPLLQIAAKWGYAATAPTAIKRATILQARSVFKAAQMSSSTVQLTFDGQQIHIPALDSGARLALEPFVRYSEVDDGRTV